MLYQRGKKGTYWFRFRFAGRFVHESARTKLVTIARDAERQRRRELEEKFNRLEKRSLPPTLKAAAKLWLEKRSALESSTRDRYAMALKRLQAGLGNMLVCDVTAQKIDSYQRRRQDQGAAGATINKEIVCLGCILGEYGLWAPIKRDVRRLEENEEAGRALTLEEEKWLLACAATIGQHQGNWTPLYTVTLLGLNTGLRHTEIRRLRWKNLDLSNRILTVGESKTEVGKGRPIPLTQPAWAALEMWAARFPERKSNQYVFPASENGEIDPTRPIANWRTAWRHATRSIACPRCAHVQNPGITCRREECKAEIREVKSAIVSLRFHDLRHTAATKLLECGTPFAVVAQILGWAPSTAVRMAKRYGHIRPEVQRRALEAITTPEIPQGVNQNVHQMESVIISERPN